MKSIFSFLAFTFLCLTANGQSVGINTTSPHSSAALDVNSFDQGILVPRLKTSARTGIVNPATGLLVYDVDFLRFYTYNGTAWVGLSTIEAFENFYGLVRNGGNVYQDDFLFGAHELPPNGQVVSDTSFFFDKSKGAFRMGRVTNSDRSSETNLGTWSVAGGSNNLVSGSNSVAFGSENFVTGNFAAALGTTNESSGEYSFTAGAINKATNLSAIALGITSEANGYSSVAAGSGVVAESFASTALGQYNEGIGNSSSWVATDPILEIGIGTHYINDRKNAMTILKNGKTGIGTTTPDTSLSVVGVARAAFDESEMDYIEMSHGGNNAFINKAGAGNIDIRHEDVNIMTLTSGQDVGIGTNSPDVKLSVIGKVRGAYLSNENEFTEIYHGGGNGYINTIGDGNLDFRHDNNTVMSLNDAGDLFVDGQLTLGNANTTQDYTFPSMDGSTDQILKTDGNGNLNWENDDQGGNIVIDASTSTIIIGDNGTTENFVFGMDEIPQPSTNYSDGGFIFRGSRSSFRTGVLDNSNNWQNSESGIGSFGAGKNIIASGDYSAAFGNLTEANAINSFAAGENTEATGLRSAAFGNFTTASGESAFAIGRTGNAFGKNSFKSGFNTFANGDNSATFGVGNSAHGYASMAAGDGNIVNARSSMALGAGLETNSYGCFAIGAFNEGNGSNPDIWVGTASEPIFEIGIGTAVARKNALTINKAGSVAIGNSAASAILSVDAGGTAPLFIVERDDDDIFEIDGDDIIQIYNQTIMHDRLDLWPQVDRLVQYRIELPNIATIEDGTAVAYNWDTYSDQRVKKQIEEIHYGLEEVLTLNPVEYHHHSTDYKDGFLLREDYSEEIGFIAQEVYDVIKEVVNKPEDESKALWTMNYEKLTPVLVKAIQEQQVIIENLKDQLTQKDLEMKNLRSDVDKLFKMVKDNN